MKERARLKAYREKRDFRRTPEPKGEERSDGKKPVFVIQKHDARRLHYDFRLEVNGVLKSWAVPKGPSTDPAQKRLAVATEDHPMEYADFEGVIPEGEYGAGKVIVWDTGSYRNITEKNGESIPIEKAIEHGHVAVWLEGKKLAGGYALNRFRRDRQEQWLLVKMKDEAADPEIDPLASQPRSVLSKRSLEEVQEDEAEEKTAFMNKVVRMARNLIGKKRARKNETNMPSHVEPMLALPSKMPGNAENYAFEYKWDGIRAVYFWDGRHMRVESRNKLDITHQWPELNKLGEVFGSTPVILDGEIVALDPKGRISFSLLSRRMHLSSKPTAAQINAAPAAYMIFDLLYLKDRVLMELTYRDRRSLLEELRLSDDKWQTPPAHREEPEAMLEAALKNGLEGLVAKKWDSAYRPGARTREWLKIKPVNSQEFVIGGWIPEKGSPTRGVGSLLLGYYDEEKHLAFAGKVGTGFTTEDREALKDRFDSIAIDSCPFSEPVKQRSVKFVEPRMVAEIEFREWTPDGKLRHPSFKGLRDDKNPRDVVRETVG